LSRVPRRVARTVLRGRRRSNASALPDVLHWIRDVTFKEDSSTLRKGPAPRVLATLRNLAVSLLRLFGYDNIAAGRRDVAWDHDRLALDLIGV